MPDKKLTDNEIIKIKKRLKDIVEENELEYFHSNTMGWYPEIRLAYMAIKHLQAENERLKNNITTLTRSISELTAEVERQRKDKDDAFLLAADIVNADKIVRAEAYKEFAERLNLVMRDRYLFENKRCSMFITPEDIKQALRELVGDTDV